MAPYIYIALKYSIMYKAAITGALLVLSDSTFFKGLLCFTVKSCYINYSFLNNKIS